MTQPAPKEPKQLDQESFDVGYRFAYLESKIYSQEKELLKLLNKKKPWIFWTEGQERVYDSCFKQEVNFTTMRLTTLIEAHSEMSQIIAEHPEILPQKFFGDERSRMLPTWSDLSTKYEMVIGLYKDVYAGRTGKPELVKAFREWAKRDGIEDYLS